MPVAPLGQPIHRLPGAAIRSAQCAADSAGAERRRPCQGRPCRSREPRVGRAFQRGTGRGAVWSARV